jgi:hypothetical protein
MHNFRPVMHTDTMRVGRLHEHINKHYYFNNVRCFLSFGGGERSAQVLVGKPEGKRPLGRPRHRWEENIKMDLQEVVGGCGD